MTTINCNPNVMAQQNTRGRKLAKHLVNTAVLGTGAVLVSKGARKAAMYYDWGAFAEAGKTTKSVFASQARDFYKKMSKFVNTAIPEGSKLHNALEKFYGAVNKPHIAAAKGKLAIYGVATAAILALVTAGIYKAGKINGGN